MKVSVLSVLAGLIYSSWPLGYWLNPPVAHHSLASGLEALHQPYNWVFIGMDILSSLLIVVVCGLLWNRYKKRLSGTLRTCLIGAVLFALGTTIDALLPEHCVPNLMQCPNFTQDHFLLFHGIFSILASVFLFVALAACWLANRKSPLLSMLLLGYVVFGLISLVQAVVPGHGGNWSQDYYMALCSVWVGCLPYAAAKTARSA